MCTESVPAVLPVDYVAVTSGFEFACGIQLDGYMETKSRNVNCWGADAFGQIHPPPGASRIQYFRHQYLDIDTK
eukprot:7929235-Pyramimonas_sp.AAC.2